MQSKDFVFTVDNEGLAYEYVVGRYFIDFQGDTDTLYVKVEGSVTQGEGSVIAVRQVAVGDDIQGRCRYPDFMLETRPSVEELRVIVDCLVSSGQASVEFRGLGEPAWIERGHR